MDPQPLTLSGARIRLEPIGPRHAEDLYAAGKDEVIWRYLTTPPFASLEDAEQWVEMCSWPHGNRSQSSVRGGVAGFGEGHRFHGLPGH